MLDKEKQKFHPGKRNLQPTSRNQHLASSIFSLIEIIDQRTDQLIGKRVDRPPKGNPP